MYVLPDVIFRRKTVPVKLVVHIFVLLVVIAGERGAEGSYFVPKAPISRTLYHGCTISFKVIVGSVNTRTLYVKWTYSFRQPYWHNAAARPLESDHWPGDLSWRWQYDGLLHHVWITTDELFRFQKKNSMKYVVNRIPQRIGIRSRNYQSYIQTLWSTNHFCSFGPHTRPPFNALIHLKHGSEWRSSKVVLWKCKGRCEQ